MDANSLVDRLIPECHFACHGDGATVERQYASTADLTSSEEGKPLENRGPPLFVGKVGYYCSSSGPVSMDLPYLLPIGAFPRMEKCIVPRTLKE